MRAFVLLKSSSCTPDRKDLLLRSVWEWSDEEVRSLKILVLLSRQKRCYGLCRFRLMRAFVLLKPSSCSPDSKDVVTFCVGLG